MALNDVTVDVKSANQQVYKIRIGNNYVDLTPEALVAMMDDSRDMTEVVLANIALRLKGLGVDPLDPVAVKAGIDKVTFKTF